jgi:hypothetical protein
VAVGALSAETRLRDYALTSMRMLAAGVLCLTGVACAVVATVETLVGRVFFFGLSDAAAASWTGGVDLMLETDIRYPRV